MPRTLQLLLCTLLLTLLGAPPASARFLSADPLGHDASMSLYDYCNGDPVNGLDPDGRVGVGANVENDLNSIDSAVNQSSLDQVHDSLDGAITSDDIADAVGGLASGYDQLLGGSGNPVNDAGSSVGSYIDNTVQTGQQSWTVATSSQATFGQKAAGGAVFAANAVLFGMNLVPGEGALENDVIGGVERSAAGSVGAAEEAPQVFYRGDQAGQAGFQSYAAQAGGIENSQAVLANGNLNDLMASHAISSEFPPSPFISVTTDIEEANRFAGPGGTVYTLELAPGRAIPNPYNVGESEYLVPHSISPSEITGTIPYRKP